MKTPYRTGSLLVLVALLATFAIYWLGLKGPFIFDDSYALEPVVTWASGDSSWRDAVFGDGPLLFSRAVAMASFLLTTWIGGPDSFSFKLGNLVVHLACGILVWRIGRRAFALDSRLQRHAELLAAILTALWLLHPLHVSTVLYAVQRMAQLSTLFTLAAVLVYLNGRQSLASGAVRSAWGKLFIAFPLMVIAGLLSKQNAAVAPLLCLALEIGYFNDWSNRRGTLTTFFGVFLLVPTALGAAVLLLYPNKILAGYQEWDFTLGQRLLTQPRALMDYVGMLLFPRGPRMGLYTDDFVVSTGLNSPATTWMAIAALVLISAAAVALRKRAPSVFVGWFFFLGAHVVESSFLPIEMYYEHRNYLPSVGLLMGLIGCAALIPRNLEFNVLTPRQLATGAATGFILVLAAATFGRVLVWQSMDGILTQALRFHPNSLRASFDAADLAASRGDYATHHALMLPFTKSHDPRHRQMARFELVSANCRIGATGNAELMKEAAAEGLPRLTVVENYGIMRISSSSRSAGCGDLDRYALAQYVDQIVEAAAPQPESARTKWMTRYLLAEMYGSSGHWADAVRQAEIAWKGGNDRKVGVYLARAYASDGRIADATRMLALMEAQIPVHDLPGQKALTALRALIAERAGEATTAILPGSA